MLFIRVNVIVFDFLFFMFLIILNDFNVFIVARSFVVNAFVIDLAFAAFFLFDVICVIFGFIVFMCIFMVLIVLKFLIIVIVCFDVVVLLLYA